MSEERVTQFLVRIRQPAMVERVRVPGIVSRPASAPPAAIEDYHVRDALYDARFEGIAQHEQIQVAVLSEEHVGRLRLPSHADAPSTARIWPAWVDRFAEHDPDVEWPSDKHEDPIAAIVLAFDRVREKDATAIRVGDAGEPASDGTVYDRDAEGHAVLATLIALLRDEGIEGVVAWTYPEPMNDRNLPNRGIRFILASATHEQFGALQRWLESGPGRELSYSAGSGFAVTYKWVDSALAERQDETRGRY